MWKQLDEQLPKDHVARRMVAANASRHRLLNEDRLNKRREALAATCVQDRQGEAPATVPAWMAKTPATRIAQTQRYEQAKARMDQFQASNERQNPARRRPRRKIVVSATDPASGLGPDKEKVFRPLYDLQLMRDLDSPLALAFQIFAQHTDVPQGIALDASGRRNARRILPGDGR